MDAIRVMIISKDTDLVKSIEDCLPVDDCRFISTSEFGDDLKCILEDLHPDILLVDIVLPDMDGIETCLRIRRWCPAPMILLTKWQTKKCMFRGLDLQSYDYVSEPFHSKELLHRIEQALS